jgi:hypothetical protein
MPILISIHVYPERGRVTHIYRQLQPRGSLVIREIDDIGGFKAQNMAGLRRPTIAGVQAGFSRCRTDLIGVDPKGVAQSSRLHEICGRERG